MSLDDEVELLKKVPLFANLEASKLKLLCFTSERLRFDAGQQLMAQGEEGDAAYVIVDGTAEIVINTNDGAVKVADIGRNDFVGEMSILRDQPRNATVTATAPVTALKVTKEFFFRLVEDFPEVAVELMRGLAERLDDTTIELAEARMRLHNVCGDTENK